ncbi:MAG: TolC family protein [Janthinobacterium lividum]
MRWKGSSGVTRVHQTRPVLLTRQRVRLCALACLCVSAAKAQHAPGSPDHPWQPPSSAEQHQKAAAEKDHRTVIEPGHLYTLPELIDLAERSNPTTRVAWEAARAQADQLRIARSDLLPALTAILVTNTTRDGVLLNSEFYRQTLGLYQPELQVTYLVLDFGGRSAQIAAARERLASANFSFNRVHLDVLFETSRRYYRLLDAIGQREAAQVNFDNAETVRKAVEARLAVGLATLPDALEARAAAAQANFTLQAAIGQIDISRGDLLSFLGASPLDPLNAQSLDQLHLPDTFDVDVKDATERGLAQRPELGEQLADRDAAEAAIRQARAAFLPHIDFQGQGGEIRAFGQQNQLPSTYAGPLEEWNVNLNLSWELFDGGRRQGELARAHADQRRAQAQIDQTRDDVEQQVWTAYVSVRTAFYQRNAATQLLEAARTSYAASLRSYQLGLRNTVDVVSAQRTLAQALSTDVTARTELLTQLANFAYRTGDLLHAAAAKGHP